MLLILCTAPSLYGVVLGEDSRRVIPPLHNALTHIGVTWCSDGPLTTAVRLNSRAFKDRGKMVMLTAGHLLDGWRSDCRVYFWRGPKIDQTWRYLGGSATVFYMGSGAVRGMPVVEMIRGGSQKLLSNDWALLVMRSVPTPGGMPFGPLFESLGWLMNKGVRATVDEFIEAGGSFALYAWSDRRHRLTRTCCCRIISVNGTIYRHDCDSGQGASGGPVVALLNGREIMVGMHLAEDKNNVALPNLMRIVDAKLFAHLLALSTE